MSIHLSPARHSEAAFDRAMAGMGSNRHGPNAVYLPRVARRGIMTPTRQEDADDNH